MSNAIWDLLESRVRTRPSDPVLTYVDAHGQRTELSARTLSNNVAKAANALRDEGLLDVGDTVRMEISWHWQRPVWLLASWTLGVTAGLDAGTVRITDARPLDAGDDCWIVSRHPFGLPESDLPATAIDAATLTRLQPDAFLAEDVDASSLAIDAFGTSMTITAALDRARALGLEHAIVADQRLALADPGGVDAWLWPTLVPLLGDASVVMVGDDASLADVAAAESARTFG